MTIHFTRDSVCMGDDCFDNSMDLSVEPDAPPEEILRLLVEKRFFAKIAGGNDVVWVLETHKGEALAWYPAWRESFCYGPLQGRSLHWRYCTSPAVRAAALEKQGRTRCEEYSFWLSIQHIYA